MRSTLSAFSLPKDKYPNKPTNSRNSSKIVNVLIKTFLNLLKFGFFTELATLKKLVKQLNAKTAIPKFSKNSQKLV